MVDVLHCCGNVFAFFLVNDRYCSVQWFPVSFWWLAILRLMTYIFWSMTLIFIWLMFYIALVCYFNFLILDMHCSGQWFLFGQWFAFFGQWFVFLRQWHELFWSLICISWSIPCTFLVDNLYLFFDDLLFWFMTCIYCTFLADDFNFFDW